MIDERYQDPEEIYNADDKESVNRARKKAKRKDIMRSEVIGAIMSKKEGRELIYHWLEFCDIFGNQFGTDPYATAFNCGMANVGKMIWSEVEAAAPESCILMRKEAKKDEKVD